jgi:hypothetical protein
MQKNLQETILRTRLRLTVRARTSILATCFSRPKSTPRAVACAACQMGRELADFFQPTR